MGPVEFSDKVVVVTGGASGIGGATVELLLQRGAEVHAIDVVDVRADVAGRYLCDLGLVEAIDQTVGELPDAIDVLMNCAGIPNGAGFDNERVMAVNWLGLRHLTESLLPRIGTGGSVVHVASTAGRGWPAHVEPLRELMGTPTFDAGRAWVLDHSEIVGDGYAFSKEAVQYYTMWRALQTGEHGVRMNSICPGVTNTRLLAHFRRGVGDDVIDRAISIAGRPAEPSEMAPPLLFLADGDSAGYINGVNLDVDGGTGAARLTGVWDE